MTSYAEVVPELLELLPELRSAYELMYYPKIGNTIVFENLLVRHIVAIAADSNQFSQLHKIMGWIEVLTNSPDMDVRNLVATSIGEPLVGSYSDILPTIFPYMGSRTKEFCKVIFVFFKVSDETKRLFKDVALIKSIRD